MLRIFVPKGSVILLVLIGNNGLVSWLAIALAPSISNSKYV